MNTAVRTIEVVQYVLFSHDHKVYITKHIQLHLVVSFVVINFLLSWCCNCYVCLAKASIVGFPTILRKTFSVNCHLITALLLLERIFKNTSNNPLINT